MARARSSARAIYAPPLLGEPVGLFRRGAAGPTHLSTREKSVERWVAAWILCDRQIGVVWVVYVIFGQIHAIARPVWRPIGRTSAANRSV